MPTKILVTGSSGQLGREFCLLESKNFEMIGIGREEADITDVEQVRVVVKKHRPDIVIHTAAMTDVDGCEKDPKLAMQVNSVGSKNMAVAANEAGAAVVYFSTDYVFDGNKVSAYNEIDTPNAISNYGKSKLAGEQATIESNQKYTIIRTGWVYSRYRSNFVKTIIKKALSGRALKVVNDQFGSPTWTKDIVRQTMKIIESKQTGLFHVASKGEVSRFALTKMIVKKLNLNVMVEAVSTSEMPRPAPRPKRSSLVSERLDKLGIDTMRPYEIALDEFLSTHEKELLDEFKN